MINILKTILGILTLVLGWCLGIGIVSFFLGLPVMWLWNWIMPDLFDIQRLTYLQSTGILLLVNLLFRLKVNIRDKK